VGELTPAPARGSASAFWPALWLGVCLAAAKAAHWSLPEPNLRRLSEYATDLWVSAHADLLFAAVFGLAAAIALRAAAGRPRAWRWTYAAVLALGAVCVLYAVASVRIFAYLRSPLTYPLLYLAGDMASMRSSIGSFLDQGTLALLLGGPAAFLLAVRATRRWPVPRLLASRGLVVAGVVLLGLGVWGARRALDGRWGDRDDRLIAKSPHWAILASYGSELVGSPAEPLDVAFGPAELGDFETPSVSPGFQRPAGVAPPRNVILLVLESTGTRYLGLYGGRYPTTPRLEREAASALVFDDFYSHAGLTANALASLSLSIYPYMTWREYTVEYPGHPGATLADLLGPRGYRTAFIHSGDLAYVGQDRFLRGRGFDVLWGAGELPGAAPLTSWGVEERHLTDGVLRFIDQDRARPFFVTAWTSQSHHPYEPSPAAPLVDFFAGRPLPPDDYDLGRYLNTLAEVDRQVGRLFDGLRARGLAEDTLVVITGDHGEAFGDPHDAWGHGSRLWEENVRVPLMIWSPRLFSGGGRSATIGGHVDVNPTVADLLDLPPAPSWQGRSLFAPGRPPRTYFYAARDSYLLGVRENALKYVYDATRGRDALYDLAADPDERRNLAADHSDTCRRLRSRLAAWRDFAARKLRQAVNPAGGEARVHAAS
jgi:arylsulfatase A-like enzyme